jgi:hypothetical protein
MAERNDGVPEDRGAAGGQSWIDFHASHKSCRRAGKARAFDPIRQGVSPGEATMKHMTVLLGLAFLLSNVTSAITQEQKDWSPETTIKNLARMCFEQKTQQNNVSPPRPPSGSGITWDENVDGYCNWREARQLRDAIRQYKDPGGRRGNCKGGTFTDQLQNSGHRPLLSSELRALSQQVIRT